MDICHSWRWVPLEAMSPATSKNNKCRYKEYSKKGSDDGQTIKLTSRKGASALLGVGIVVKKAIWRDSVNDDH